MAAELPQPGVQIIQEFRTVSPSVVTPTLVPCIVGACRQIVEVLNGQALNADSKVALSALFTASNASLSGNRYVYTGLNGKQAILSVNNSPQVTVAFTQDYITPAGVVDAFNNALSALGVYGAVAETVQEFDSTGALIEITGSPFIAGVSPGSVAVDPTSNFVYVACSGPWPAFDNTVFAYAINSSTGALTAIAGSPFAAGTKPGSVATIRIKQ